MHARNPRSAPPLEVTFTSVFKNLCSLFCREAIHLLHVIHSLSTHISVTTSFCTALLSDLHLRWAYGFIYGGVGDQLNQLTRHQFGRSLRCPVRMRTFNKRLSESSTPEHGADVNYHIHVYGILIHTYKHAA